MKTIKMRSPKAVHNKFDELLLKAAGIDGKDKNGHEVGCVDENGKTWDINDDCFI